MSVDALVAVAKQMVDAARNARLDVEADLASIKRLAGHLADALAGIGNRCCDAANRGAHCDCKLCWVCDHDPNNPMKDSGSTRDPYVGAVMNIRGIKRFGETEFVPCVVLGVFKSMTDDKRAKVFVLNDGGDETYVRVADLSWPGVFP